MYEKQCLKFKKKVRVAVALETTGAQRKMEPAKMAIKPEMLDQRLLDAVVDVVAVIEVLPKLTKETHVVVADPKRRDRQPTLLRVTPRRRLSRLKVAMPRVARTDATMIDRTSLRIRTPGSTSITTWKGHNMKR